ncbi:hypothetical protein N7522_013874 [Penicillium canescens]|nr:hypothetical protein N7522_013874 [Penicillium canescens]
MNLPDEVRKLDFCMLDIPTVELKTCSRLVRVITDRQQSSSSILALTYISTRLPKPAYADDTRHPLASASCRGPAPQMENTYNAKKM